MTPVRTRPAGPLVVLAALLGAVVVGVLAAPAHADDSVGHISRMDVTAELGRDGGTARVELDFTYDFGQARAHGPFLVLAELQEIVDDPDRYRRMEITDVTAETGTDAPDDLRVERDSGAVQLYIGDEDVEVTGAHDYRVAYTIDGLVTPEVAGPDGAVRDELFWNVVAPGGFDIDIHDVTVAVTGPGPAEATACYVGRTGSDTACDGDGGGRGGQQRVELAHEQLDDGEGLSVVVGWPAGTFADAEPVYEPRRTWANTIQLTPLTGGAAGLLTVLGAGGAVVVASRRGRDQAYLGMTPGLTPTDDAHVTERARRRQPVAVRFTPPDDVRPGEIGTLHDEVADPHDVSATLVDLAVRGYVRIEEIAPEDPDDDVEDWRIVPLREWDGLEPYEADLLDRIFTDGREPVTLSDAAKEYAAAVGKTQEALYRTVTEHGWFKGNPSKVRTRWVVGGLALLVLGVAVAGVLVALHWPAILGVPLVVTGVVVMVAAAAAPARTAAGTAVLAQALGFRQYLATAEAHQIRFEEGRDVFSRYLPYAMVFELTDRWAQILSDVAAQGRDVAAPTWYVPVAAGTGWWTHPEAFTASVGAFADAATSAVTAAAGGGSGFSGSVGAGAGGMGGGSW